MFWNGNWIQDLGFRIPCQWKLDFIFQSLLGLRIPELNSVFQSPGFRIPPTKIFRIPVSGSITLPRLLFPPTTESLSNDDGDGNENGKKANMFRSTKQQLCTYITRFFCISLLSLHDYNVKVPNFTFCRGRERRRRLSFSFPELWYSLLEFHLRKICQHLTNWTS